jgi:hypothetical protein
VWTRKGTNASTSLNLKPNFEESFVKTTLRSVIVLLLSLLTTESLSAASWSKLVDCEDTNGNQLVIDIDVLDNAHFQMVLRPAPKGSSSIIDYLMDNSMVHSQASYNEIVVPVHPGIYEDFINSDQLLTHKVDLDNVLPSRMYPNTGARLTVSQSRKSVDWYFDNCKKSY